MPPYRDGEQTLEINRRATLLDAGPLVAAFSRKEEDTLRENAFLSLHYPQESGTNQWIVPAPVIVESWGWLTGKTRLSDPEGARNMLRWINDPGNPVVVLRYCLDAATAERLVVEYKVDVVDAMLIAAAESISAQCALRPPVQLATIDTRDFSRMKNLRNSAVRIYDVRHRQGEDDDDR